MLRAQSGHRPYARLHEIITDCAHPEHRETLTWCGGRFDPEAFNLDRTNRDIKARLRPNRRIRYRQILLQKSFRPLRRARLIRAWQLGRQKD